MKIMRKPQVNAVIIGLISAFYALIFIITSGHVEFQRLLSHTQTLQSPFWNGWRGFIAEGGMKYVGYAYIAVSVVIILLALVRKRDYDEYQMSILGKGFAVSGAVLAVMFPLALLMMLSDPNYSIEVLMLLVTIHWSSVLLADLIYVIKWKNE